MSPTQKKRFIIVGVILTGMSLATFLALKALEETAQYFITPTQIHSGDYEKSKSGLYRVGGLVVNDSVNRFEDGVTVQFDLTDTAQKVTVQYTGILPDLFREGQGIVANGRIDQQGIFVAHEVLAKHDENYMPKEAMEALEKSGAKIPHNYNKSY